MVGEFAQKGTIKTLLTVDISVSAVVEGIGFYTLSYDRRHYHFLVFLD